MSQAAGRYLSFDAVADDYDRTRVIPPDIVRDIARLCADAAHLRRGGLFLDAGVGTGRFGAPLSLLHPGQIIGADVSLPMMQRARAKATRGAMALIHADLQRLPFRAGAFRGALLVHILHLIERWPLVLTELRRVLQPRTGVLLLGLEEGGRSAIMECYYDRARALGVLPPSLGSPGLTQPLAWLRRPEGGGARVEALSVPYLVWTRRVSVGQTLAALAGRTYSQTWAIPEDAHRPLLADAEQYARRAFGGPDAEETLHSQFRLYTVRWL